MNKKDINIKEKIEELTNQRFKKKGNKLEMCCPLHSEKTPSFTVQEDKQFFKCFGCGKSGDIITFVREYKGLDFVDACKLLNIELDEKQKALLSEGEQLQGLITWYSGKLDGYKLENKYRFVDIDNNLLYYKLKFRSTKDNSKIFKYAYYDDQGKKFRAGRGAKDENGNILTPEVPYNLHKLNKAIKQSNNVFIVEGEKDVDNVQREFNCIATSLKGLDFNNFNFGIFQGAKVYIIPDTGKAGSKYVKEIYEAIKNYVVEFNIVELPGIEKLGDNKDVTDWLKSGHTKEEFKKALLDVWDWKKSEFWRVVVPRKTKGKNEEIIYVPVKCYENLELLLQREGIKLRKNSINREIEATGTDLIRNALLVEIYNLCKKRGFDLSKDNVRDYINSIALNNEYNPFLEYLCENENDDYSILDNVFNCLCINPDYAGNTSFYKILFKKWLINVVRTAHNNIEKSYESQGMLVLQGEQGCFKSTFCKLLLNNSNWFIGGKILNPDNKDSVKQNTKYIIVELGELDGTFSKSEQARLKAFISSPSDEYREPYAQLEDKFPRITTYCATINKNDFLKDETGSRRFWVVPVEKCDVEKLKKIDINKFWGAVYSAWKNGIIAHNLTKEEENKLQNNNIDFSVENDITIKFNELFDWQQNEKLWKTYSITELCKVLEVFEGKAVKNELLRKGYKYQSHRDNYHAKNKKGYKLPNVDEKETQAKADQLQIDIYEQIEF